jgi:leader peptidase (prepilin peptidase) / N-methyltransferase
MTPLHHLVLVLFFLVVGSCVGSFLNVCIHRIPIGLSVLRPRSRCPSCLTAIRARDNLPVLGWLILGGRCRHCRATISPRYPIVELTVGLLFAAVALAPGDVWQNTGPFGILTLLLAPWGLICMIVVGALMGYDRRGIQGARRAAVASKGRRRRWPGVSWFVSGSRSWFSSMISSAR